MLLGYLTKYSEEEVKLARNIGYDALELQIGSWGDVVNDLDKAAGALKQSKDILDKNNLKVSALAYYTNDAPETKERIKRYKNAILATKLLGANVLTTLAGGIKEKGIEENVEIWAESFKEIAKIAESEGVKIAFENWPAISKGFPLTSGNLACLPSSWEKMFEAVPSKALGLEFDPSHLVWQGIDYLGAVKKFADRIHHVHAKDTEIFEDKFAQYGMFSSGLYRYRIPGYGCIDWFAFFSLLRECGFDGGVAIEHEDSILKGEIGLRLGYNFLRPVVI